jgi:uncharacterized protein (TIGR02284 family)
MNNYDSIEILNSLIQTCKDGQEGFVAAAQAVKSDELEMVFQEIAAQREQFAEDLTELVASLHGDPKEHGTITGMLHRGWLDLRSAVSAEDDAAILSECERGEDVAKENYGAALEKAMPIEIAEIVRGQFDAVLEAHRRIRSLRNGTRPGTNSASAL